MKEFDQRIAQIEAKLAGSWRETVEFLFLEDKQNGTAGNLREITGFLYSKGFFWASKEGVLLENLDKILKLKENEESQGELEGYLNNIEDINEKKGFEEEWKDVRRVYLEMEKENFTDFWGHMEKISKISEDIRKKIILNLLSSKKFKDFLFEQNTRKILTNKYVKNTCLCGEFNIPAFGLKNEKMAILSEKGKKKFSEEDSNIRDGEIVTTCGQSLPNLNVADI